MKKHVYVLKFIMMGLVAIAGFGAITMLLWNWLVPFIFGLAAINFWQALGLLALGRILLGGIGIGGKHWMGGGMHKHHNHNAIRERWQKMTPEERKEFVKSRGFGHHPFGRDFEHDFFNRKDDESENKD